MCVPRSIVAGVLGMTLVSSVALAQCVIMPLKYFSDNANVVAVFAGTIRDVRAVRAGQIVTVDVDRVWKGRVSKTVVVHNRQQGSSEETTFRGGERRLLIAERQTTEERAAFEIPDAEQALESNGCSSYVYGEADEYIASILGYAEGYEPQPDRN